MHPFFGIHLPHLVHPLGRLSLPRRRLGAGWLQPSKHKPRLQRAFGRQGRVGEALGQLEADEAPTPAAVLPFESQGLRLQHRGEARTGVTTAVVVGGHTDRTALTEALAERADGALFDGDDLGNGRVGGAALVGRQDLLAQRERDRLGHQ